MFSQGGRDPWFSRGRRRDLAMRYGDANRKDQEILSGHWIGCSPTPRYCGPLNANAAGAALLA